MPIKWSALKVSQAMDAVELQLSCAQPFIDEALVKVQEAKQIPNLPGYMEQRLAYLELDLKGKTDHLKAVIEAVRESIPEGAIKEELDSLKYGSPEPLI